MFSAVKSSCGASEIYRVHPMSYLNQNNQPLSLRMFQEEKKCPSIRLVKAKALLEKQNSTLLFLGFANCVLTHFRM